MYGEEQDSDVLGRARAGDERAFLALYRAAQPDLLRYVSVLVGADAERVAAATWDEVARDIGAFAGSLEGFRGWVAGVGRRLALEHLAAQPNPERPRAGAVADVVPPRAARALALISDLPAEQGEALALRAVMGIGEADAATLLGMRRGSFRRLAVRGLRGLAMRSLRERRELVAQASAARRLGPGQALAVTRSAEDTPTVTIPRGVLPLADRRASQVSAGSASAAAQLAPRTVELSS